MMNKNIKKNNGITLITLIITITVMIIVVGSTVSISLDRFKINNYRKMTNDIELIKDQISNYYLKYSSLPLLRDESNNPIQYTYTEINDKDYYIIDLSAMSGITLNYGKEGYDNPNTSKDVYVIEPDSWTVYYVEGMELNNQIYHVNEKVKNVDNSRLTSPEMEIVDGEKNENNEYLNNITIKFVPGIHKTKNVTTQYSITRINPGTNTIIENVSSGDINTITDNIYLLSGEGTYNINIISNAEEEVRSKEYTITILDEQM